MAQKHGIQEKQIEVNAMRMCGADKIRNEQIRGTARVAQVSNKITKHAEDGYTRGKKNRTIENKIVSGIYSSAKSVIYMGKFLNGSQVLSDADSRSRRGCAYSVAAVQ